MAANYGKVISAGNSAASAAGAASTKAANQAAWEEVASNINLPGISALPPGLISQVSPATEGRSGYDKFSTGAHITLSGLGTIPALGIIPDAVDWVYTAAEIPFGKSSGKDLGLASAGILATATPVVGDGLAAAAKIAKRVAAVAEGGIQYTKSSLKLGREAHSVYKLGLDNGTTLFKEFTGIAGIRPDFVDFTTKTIFELKPFNPRSIKAGTKQLENYRSIFEQHYGPGWKTVLDTY